MMDAQRRAVCTWSVFYRRPWLHVLGGAGFRRAIGARSGVQFDARVHLIGDRTSLEVDAAPEQANGSGQFAIWRGGQTPSVYFSSATDVPSSLVTPLTNFETFRASGTRVQFSLRVGYELFF